MSSLWIDININFLKATEPDTLSSLPLRALHCCCFVWQAFIVGCGLLKVTWCIEKGILEEEWLKKFPGNQSTFVSPHKACLSAYGNFALALPLQWSLHRYRPIRSSKQRGGRLQWLQPIELLIDDMKGFNTLSFNCCNISMRAWSLISCCQPCLVFGNKIKLFLREIESVSDLAIFDVYAGYNGIWYTMKWQMGSWLYPGCNATTRRHCDDINEWSNK